MATLRTTPSYLLHEATERLDRGDVPGAGCYCRASVSRWLKALCRQHDCFPVGRHTSVRDLLRALVLQNAISPQAQSSISRVVTISTQATMLWNVRPNRLRAEIERARTIVDDAADWRKGGAV